MSNVQRYILVVSNDKDQAYTIAHEKAQGTQSINPDHRSRLTRLQSLNLSSLP